MRVRIDEELIVRTRNHAGAAADARLSIEIDDAVQAFIERACGTDAHARGFIALITEDGKEEPLRLRERSFLDGLDPAAVHADRDLVLRLAGDRAGVAPDALAKIDREPVVGHAEATISDVPRGSATEPQRHGGGVLESHRGTETQRRRPDRKGRRANGS